MRHADPYLTAEALGIEERTRSGLIRLARDLADGTVPPEQFLMAVWCGTPCCIGGHLDQRRAIGDRDSQATRFIKGAGLNALFYPQRGIFCSNPRLGARAILNFLTTGDPDWAGVMRGVAP